MAGWSRGLLWLDLSTEGVEDGEAEVSEADLGSGRAVAGSASRRHAVAKAVEDFHRWNFF